MASFWPKAGTQLTCWLLTWYASSDMLSWVWYKSCAKVWLCFDTLLSDQLRCIWRCTHRKSCNATPCMHSALDVLGYLCANNMCFSEISSMVEKKANTSMDHTFNVLNRTAYPNLPTLKILLIASNDTITKICPHWNLISLIIMCA